MVVMALDSTSTLLFRMVLPSPFAFWISSSTWLSWSNFSLTSRRRAFSRLFLRSALSGVSPLEVLATGVAAAVAVAASCFAGGRGCRAEAGWGTGAQIASSYDLFLDCSFFTRPGFGTRAGSAGAADTSSGIPADGIIPSASAVLPANELPANSRGRGRGGSGTGHSGPAPASTPPPLPASFVAALPVPAKCSANEVRVLLEKGRAQSWLRCWDWLRLAGEPVLPRSSSSSSLWGDNMKRTSEAVMSSEEKASRNSSTVCWRFRLWGVGAATWKLGLHPSCSPCPGDITAVYRPACSPKESWCGIQVAAWSS
mmetsp:Transcript_22348/g.32455  ORF Transcript_22348/g.32455 Transcript_22348/m.32455 type:complete len:312 (+) Transcript_22348:799-1734(+)